MIRNWLSATLALLALALAAPAHAGVSGPSPVTTITKKDRNDNKVFVGVNWNWGAREGLTGVVGYRWAKVKTDDKVRGGLVDLTMPLTGADRFSLGELHLKALAGKRSVQGEAGIGYGFQAQAFLLNAGVRAPYATAGTDYLFGKGWQPYVGIHSMGRSKRAENTSTTTCPAGYTYESEFDVCVPDQVNTKPR